MHPHHMLFFLIYLILALWLTPSLHTFNKKTSLFIILLVTIFFNNLNTPLEYTLNTPKKKILVEYLNSLTDKQYLYIKNEDTDLSLKLDKYKIEVLSYTNKYCIDTLSCVENELATKTMYYHKPWNVRIISSKSLNEKSYPIIDNNIVFYITKFESE